VLGVNIFLPGFWFGFFSILCNLGVFYVYTRTLIQGDTQALAIELSAAPPIWTKETGLSPQFCEKFALTEREQQITEEMMRGKPNREIAECLFISLKTVETHLSSIYRKTGAPSRFALYGLIKGGDAVSG
jgi:DNA-binding CsgD family transcriptional regulator